GPARPRPAPAGRRPRRPGTPVRDPPGLPRRAPYPRWCGTNRRPGAYAGVRRGMQRCEPVRSRAGSGRPVGVRRRSAGWARRDEEGMAMGTAGEPPPVREDGGGRRRLVLPALIGVVAIIVLLCCVGAAALTAVT